MTLDSSAGKRRDSATMSALDNYPGARHSSSIHEAAGKAFDEIFKKPPSRLGDEARTKKPTDGALSAIRQQDYTPGDSSGDEDAGRGRIETTWYDSYIQKKNISVDDRTEKEAIMKNLRIPEKPMGEST